MEVAHTLPRLPAELAEVTLRREGSTPGVYRDYSCDLPKVRKALEYLCDRGAGYAGVTHDRTRWEVLKKQVVGGQLQRTWEQHATGGTAAGDGAPPSGGAGAEAAGAFDEAASGTQVGGPEGHDMHDDGESEHGAMRGTQVGGGAGASDAQVGGGVGTPGAQLDDGRDAAPRDDGGPEGNDTNDGNHREDGLLASSGAIGTVGAGVDTTGATHEAAMSAIAGQQWTFTQNRVDGVLNPEDHPFFWQQCFPTLFMVDDDGDVPCAFKREKSRDFKITFPDWCAYMATAANYRYAMHPVFKYAVLNMKNRRMAMVTTAFGVKKMANMLPTTAYDLRLRLGEERARTAASRANRAAGAGAGAVAGAAAGTGAGAAGAGTVPGAVAAGAVAVAGLQRVLKYALVAEQRAQLQGTLHLGHVLRAFRAYEPCFEGTHDIGVSLYTNRIRTHAVSLQQPRHIISSQWLGKA